jgi:predicted O-methyltransferase YrrM
MRPAGLVAVCNEIVLSQCRCVLELGSGTSTVLLARLLAQQGDVVGPHHVAVEHDAHWAKWVEGQLQREGLHALVTVLHVPLAAHPRAEPGLLWYEERRLLDGLDAALSGRTVDLLLVDGPPADGPEKTLARYPALPVLQTRLAPGATVVLDDVERAGEQEVLRRWERDTGMRFDRRAASGGVAVGRLPGAPADSGPVHG